MCRNSENAGEVTRLRGLCEELAEGLSWALDCLDLDAVLISEHVPDAWAGLDHAALHRAKAKARAVLSDSVAVLRDTAPARDGGE